MCRPNPSGLQFTSIDSGTFHSCGMHKPVTVGRSWWNPLGETKRLTCWGWATDGQLDVPDGLVFTAVAAGNGHTCALHAPERTGLFWQDIRTITCWGRDTRAQLDAPLGRFTAIAAGDNHACAIREDNRLRCWGANSADQSNQPSGQFKAIAAGADRSCGIRTDDTVLCWGSHHNGSP